MSMTDERERKMPNRHEHAFMLDLMLLRNSLVKHSEAVRLRLSCYPYAWRDIRLLCHLVNKLQGEMLDTMPESRVDYYGWIARYGQVVIDIPGPVPKDRNILIAEKHLAAVAEAAMRSECVICLKEGKDVRCCPIRNAMLEVAPPEAISDCQDGWTDCEYQSVACALVRGEEISI